MKFCKYISTVTVLVLSSITSSLCYSDVVVFDNFGPNYGFENSGSTIGGPGGGPSPFNYFDEFAMSFTPTASGNVSDIWLAFSAFQGDNFNLWISLDSGGLPTTPELLINFSASASTEILFGKELTHITATQSYFIEKDQRYWIGLNAAEEGIIGGWWWSPEGESTLVAERDLVWSEQWGYASAFYDSSVFSVAVSPVSVPAAVWLFGSGLLGLIGVAKRKA